ncbi:MAG: cytochrome c3 family protein [Pseudomonadota bacterium]
MRRGTIALILVAAFVCAMGVASAAQKAPDTISLKGATKGAVEFTHKKHVDLKTACADCHHVYKDGKNVWKQGDPVQKCDACHKTGPKPIALKDAFHNNCWKGCHVKEKKAGKPAPTTCTECHKK